mgnify:CR=1 FL=1|jgi:hypothetical protein
MKNYVIIASVDDGRYTPVKLTEWFNPEEMCHMFRLLDADGEVLLYGLSNNSSSFEPQDDYEAICGCTTTEYFNTVFNEWEEL